MQEKARTDERSSIIIHRMTIEEFQKAELRIGRILEAERVAGSEKLVRIRVDLGAETRQVLAGVGKAYAPEALVGREIVVVANLDPRMMMGLESQGMLLAASDSEGAPVILSPDRAVPPGCVIS